MRRLIWTPGLIVAAAGILALVPAARVSGQQGDTTQRASSAKKKPTAATRIKLTKNETRTAGGEVVMPVRSDTMTRTETTTAAVPTVPDTSARTDTIPTPDTVRVVDTTIAQPVTTPDTTARIDTTAQPRPMRTINTRFGKVYFGLAAGASVPSGDIYNGYNPGVNLTLPVGWDSPRLPLGLRFDLSYDRLMARSTFRNNGQTTALVTTTGTSGYSTGTATTPAASSGSTTGSTAGTSTSGYSGTARVANSDASLASAMLDAKLRLPVFGARSSTFLYALAGGGLHYFFNYQNSLALTNPAAEQAKFAALHAHNNSVGTTAYNSASYSSSGYSAVTRFGTNAGAGMQWGVGPANMFVEGRYVTVLTKDRHTNYWPILLGISWK